MARPRNIVPCPLCGAALRLLRTSVAGPDDRDADYLCEACGFTGRRREIIQGDWIRSKPPVELRGRRIEARAK